MIELRTKDDGIKEVVDVTTSEEVIDEAALKGEIESCNRQIRHFTALKAEKQAILDGHAVEFAEVAASKEAVAKADAEAAAAP